jgi:hypothetical protein
MITIWKRACGKARERLQAAADQRNSVDPWTLKHAEGCVECRRFLELLKNLGPELRMELDARLDGETQPKGGSLGNPQIRRLPARRWKLAGVAAAALVFCSAGLYLAVYVPSRARMSSTEWTNEIFASSSLDGLETAAAGNPDSSDLTEWLLDL